MKKIAISIGDLNGIGIAIALLSHETITKLCHPVYCINQAMLQQASERLNIDIPENFATIDVPGDFDIEPGIVSAKSGQYAYDSFQKAISLAESGEVDAVTTLPIHKEAWAAAGISYVGHTDMLRDHFKKEAIMMLGCEKMFVALFTEHIPLANVAASIASEPLKRFLIGFYNETKADKIAVLGLNPHAGDNGVLGTEERQIERAIEQSNDHIGHRVFHGPLVPDIAFTPSMRQSFTHYVAMYHDQGLAPLKALYFDESINVSLNLPIVRTSVDHGTAFDIAYKQEPNILSYLNAIKTALALIR